MQEKKNKRLLALAGLLILAIGGTWWAGREDESYRPDKNLFRDFEIESVDQVVLRSSSDTVMLKYTGSGWTVNDSFPADRNRIMVLFATLQQAEPKRPVASSLRDSISHYISANGVHATLSSGNERVQEFVVAGNPAKTETWFMKEDKEEPFIMNIPGYRTFVGGIFELDEGGWRDKRIFRFNWENFRKLETRFRNPAGNFSVFMKDRVAAIPGVPQPDTTKLNQYMDYLSLLTVDEFLPAGPGPDSLSKMIPVAEFLIEDIASRTFTLALFPPQQGTGVHALVNGSQWAVIQEDRIFPVLRPKEFFVKR